MRFYFFITAVSILWKFKSEVYDFAIQYQIITVAIGLSSIVFAAKWLIEHRSNNRRWLSIRLQKWTRNNFSKMIDLENPRIFAKDPGQKFSNNMLYGFFLIIPPLLLVPSSPITLAIIFYVASSWIKSILLALAFSRRTKMIAFSIPVLCGLVFPCILGLMSYGTQENFFFPFYEGELANIFIYLFGIQFGRSEWLLSFMNDLKFSQDFAHSAFNLSLVLVPYYCPLLIAYLWYIGLAENITKRMLHFIIKVNQLISIEKKLIWLAIFLYPVARKKNNMK
jgi:hypothetical protein